MAVAPKMEMWAPSGPRGPRAKLWFPADCLHQTLDVTGRGKSANSVGYFAGGVRFLTSNTQRRREAHTPSERGDSVTFIEGTEVPAYSRIQTRAL